MNVNTGRIDTIENLEKELGKGKLLGEEEVKETLVPVPNLPKVKLVMSTWGKRKRDRYKEFVDTGTSLHEAYYMVEYNEGKEI